MVITHGHTQIVTHTHTHGHTSSDTQIVITHTHTHGTTHAPCQGYLTVTDVSVHGPTMHMVLMRASSSPISISSN